MIPGSVSVSDLRPPPDLRTRPWTSGPTPPARASTTPRVTVGRDTPAAAATAAIPPRPNAMASAPSSNRRCRSSSCGNNTANFATSTSSEPGCGIAQI